MAGKRASQIAKDLHIDGDTALNAIQAFNAHGLDALERRSSRPKRLWTALPEEAQGERALLLIWDNAG